MGAHARSQDSHPRNGGATDANEEQLDNATADGSPGPTEGGAGMSPGALTEVEAELAAERDRNLRLRAELENVRARTSRELADQRRYAALPVVGDLLGVLDNVDRAIAAAEKNHDASSLLEGFRMVRQQIVTLLERHHCQEILAQGAEFDPQYHSAILHQPSPDVPANHVAVVTQAGYQMHERVVRPAEVIVSSGPA